MVLYGSNDGIPSSGSNSPTECQEEVCSFMVTKHSWKGKYKVFASLTFNLTLLTFDVCSGCSVWAPPPSPPTTRVRWSQPTHGTTQTLSASSPPPGDRSEARACYNMLVIVSCAGVTTKQRVHYNFHEGGKEDRQHEILQ